jgi:catechol 2,3-dioxygenase-like lactoylglutathione lyase family enzyme
MASIKSISGLVFYVQNIEDTKKFYEELGFKFATNTGDEYIKAYINWFWVEFVAQDKAEKSVFHKEADMEAQHKGAGSFVEISVDNVDEFYEDVKSKGLKSSSEPKDWPWGRREFVLRDPDGYKLVFFTKK